MRPTAEAAAGTVRIEQIMLLCTSEAIWISSYCCWNGTCLVTVKACSLPPSARLLFVFSVGQIKQYPVLSAELYLLSWKSILPFLFENRLFPSENTSCLSPLHSLTCLCFDQVVCYITTYGLYSWASERGRTSLPPNLQFMYLFSTSSSFSLPYPPHRKKNQLINRCIY